MRKVWDDAVYNWTDGFWYYMDRWFEEEYKIEPISEELFEI